jgi:hypothetical protein
LSRTSDEALLAALLAEIRVEFPRFRMVRKDQALSQRLIHLVLQGLTAGAMTKYLDDYQTTIGSTVYVSRDWDERPALSRWVVLRHERVHLRQFRRFSLPGMALIYLVVPLPAVLALGRAALEKEAYAETIRSAASAYGIRYVRAQSFRNHIVRQFTGPSYGWMWPFRAGVERWYDQVVAGLGDDLPGPREISA